MNVFRAGTQEVMPIIRGNLNPASTIGDQKWEDTLSCQICNEKQKHSWKITKMLSSEHSSIKINQELLVRLEKQEGELKHLRQKVNHEQDSSKWHERIMIENEGAPGSTEYERRNMTGIVKHHSWDLESKREEDHQRIELLCREPHHDPSKMD